MKLHLQPYAHILTHVYTHTHTHTHTYTQTHTYIYIYGKQFDSPQYEFIFFFY